MALRAVIRRLPANPPPCLSNPTTSLCWSVHVTMGGPNLEVFKFATYVFVPILVMAHFGNPEWYQKNVLPVSARIASEARRTELISCL